MPGGGIANLGSLTVSNSTFFNNIDLGFGNTNDIYGTFVDGDGKPDLARMNSGKLASRLNPYWRSQLDGPFEGRAGYAFIFRPQS
jgi:hypothetical protein